MSTPSAVPRTAPIAIAPKPSSSRFGIPSRQNSLINVDTYRPGSLRNNGLDSPDSDSPPPSHGSHPVIPCEACRRRRIKCVMSDGDDDDSCISCQINGAECSLVTEGQYYQRKRKLNGADYYGDQSRSGSKRRYECPEPTQFFFSPSPTLFCQHTTRRRRCLLEIKRSPNTMHGTSPRCITGLCLLHQFDVPLCLQVPCLCRTQIQIRV